MNRKERIQALLKGIETGDPDSVTVVNEEKYIQHNPQTHEGSLGLAELFRELAKTSPRVNIVRIFEDGDFVFGHTEYDFARSNIGFEIFRFDGDQAVEHWDNIQPRKGPNPCGHSMVDGATEVSDLDLTEQNRNLVRDLIETGLIERNFDRLEQFIDDDYVEHNPGMRDGLAGLSAMFAQHASEGENGLRYDRLHRVLAEGNFVLTVCEGYQNNQHTSFFDLFRIASGKIVEHWDTTEAIPPRSEWKNDNGKF